MTSQWRRSSFCGNSSCVEVDTTTDPVLVWVRSSNPILPATPFTHDEWRAFIEGAKAGEFDV